MAEPNETGGPFTLTGWAKGKSRDGKIDQAVRIQIIRPDYMVMEEIELRAQASGMYRREYGTWAALIGSSNAGPDGQPVRVLSPGRRLKEGYEQPDVGEDD